MVMSDKASCCRTRKCMTASYIVTGDAADYRAPDATLGEYRGGSGDAAGKRGGNSNLTKHDRIIQQSVLLR